MNKKLIKGGSISAIGIALLTLLFQYLGLDIKEIFPDEPVKPKKDSVVVNPPPVKDTIATKPKIFLPKIDKLDKSELVEHSYFTLAHAFQNKPM